MYLLSLCEVLEVEVLALEFPHQLVDVLGCIVAPLTHGGVCGEVAFIDFLHQVGCLLTSLLEVAEELVFVTKFQVGERLGCRDVLDEGAIAIGRNLADSIEHLQSELVEVVEHEGEGNVNAHHHLVISTLEGISEVA